MAKTQMTVDIVEAMKKVTVNIHFKRMNEWKLRSHIGISIVKLGLWICGFTVTLEASDTTE